MFQIDLTGNAAEGDLSPIVSVPIVVRGSQRTLALLAASLRDIDPPADMQTEEEIEHFDTLSLALTNGMVEALLSNEMIAVAVPPPPPAEEEPPPANENGQQHEPAHDSRHDSSLAVSLATPKPAKPKAGKAKP